MNRTLKRSPPVTAAKPETGAKPSGVEVNTETKSLDAGPKPETGAKSLGVEANTETKSLGARGKPETGAKLPAGAPSNKAADSKSTSHAVAAPHPAAGPNAKPTSKDNKPQ